jgi:hypothetical protein
MNPDALSPNHLMVAPILIPLLAGSIMLFYNDRNRQTKLLMGLVAVALTFLASVELMSDVKSASDQGGTVVGLYRLGDWPVPIDGDADRAAGRAIADLCRRRLAWQGSALPQHVPVPAGRDERCIPDR